MAYELLHPSDGDLARCVAVQFARTKKGDEQVCLTFKIEDGANTGRVTTYFGMFTDKSIDFTVDALRACGWAGDDASDLPAAFARGELNEQVSLKITNEQNDRGEWRDRVAFVNVPGEGGAGFRPEQAIEGDELVRFGASMRTAIAAAGRRKGKPRAATPARQPANRRAPAGRDVPTPSDDDMPW